MRIFLHSYKTPLMFLSILSLWLFCSCDTGDSKLNTSQALDENIHTKITEARIEFQKLKTSHFEAPNQFLIAPTLAAKDKYVVPHWWSHWKKELNYREDKMPQGVMIYAGDPDDPDYDYGSERTMRWNNCNLSQNEHLSFSKSGQLLSRVYVDSTLFYYDNADKLIRTISFKNNGSEEIESIRLYDYDEFGNIRWDAVFYENETGIRMNHYSKYSYLKSDSGVYVKEEQYFIDSKNEKSSLSSTEYFYFDMEQVLRKSFVRFANGTSGVTFYEYTKFDGQYYQSKKELWDINDDKAAAVDITQRDSLNRIVLQVRQSGGYFGLIHSKDSIVYLIGNESEIYNYESSNSLGHSLEKIQDDAFKNPLTIQRFRFTNLSDLQAENVSKIKYELLENGTWYSSICINTDLESGDGDTWSEYVYRKFMDNPVDPYTSKYKEFPILYELLEKFFPEATKSRN